VDFRALLKELTTHADPEISRCAKAALASLERGDVSRRRRVILCELCHALLEEALEHN
jgi:hypothetical protein